MRFEAGLIAVMGALVFSVVAMATISDEPVDAGYLQAAQESLLGPMDATDGMGQMPETVMPDIDDSTDDMVEPEPDMPVPDTADMAEPAMPATDTGTVMDASDDEPVAPMSAEVEVAIGSSIPGCEETGCYLPVEVTISAGGTVTWINDDAVHTITAGDFQSGQTGIDYPGGFDSDLSMSGTTFEHTFEEPGEYPYFCLLHPWMVGKVIVV